MFFKTRSIPNNTNTNHDPNNKNPKTKAEEEEELLETLLQNEYRQWMDPNNTNNLQLEISNRLNIAYVNYRAAAMELKLDIEKEIQRRREIIFSLLTIALLPISSGLALGTETLFTNISLPHNLIDRGSDMIKEKLTEVIMHASTGGGGDNGGHAILTPLVCQRILRQTSSTTTTPTSSDRIIDELCTEFSCTLQRIRQDLLFDNNNTKKYSSLHYLSMLISFDARRVTKDHYKEVLSELLIQSKEISNCGTRLFSSLPGWKQTVGLIRIPNPNPNKDPTTTTTATTETAILWEYDTTVRNSVIKMGTGATIATGVGAGAVATTAVGALGVAAMGIPGAAVVVLGAGAIAGVGAGMVAVPVAVGGSIYYAHKIRHDTNDPKRYKRIVRYIIREEHLKQRARESNYWRRNANDNTDAILESYVVHKDCNWSPLPDPEIIIDLVNVKEEEGKDDDESTKQEPDIIVEKEDTIASSSLSKSIYTKGKNQFATTKEAAVRRFRNESTKPFNNTIETDLEAVVLEEEQDRKQVNGDEYEPIIMVEAVVMEEEKDKTRLLSKKNLEDQSKKHLSIIKGATKQCFTSSKKKVVNSWNTK